MKPYYDDGRGIVIFHGDCREILPSLDKVDLVLTDPPYGIDYEAYQPGSIVYSKIHGDDSEFDPRFLIPIGPSIIWGANNFANLLPVGGWIVWDKRVNEAADKMMGSPFELAWCSKRNIFRMIRVQHGGAKNADAVNGDVANGARFHPTQKPVRVFTSCISIADDCGNPILDPFMGSGTTLRAAKDLGRKAIGIEIEEKYCEIAARRLQQEVFAL